MDGNHNSANSQEASEQQHALNHPEQLNHQPPHHSPILDLTFESESSDPDNPTGPFSLPVASDIPEELGHGNPN